MDAPAISATSRRKSRATARPPFVFDVPGRPHPCTDNRETLEHSEVLYDALYRWRKERKQDNKPRKPEAYR